MDCVVHIDAVDLIQYVDIDAYAIYYIDVDAVYIGAHA